MKKELIPFLMVGDPSVEATEALVTTLVDVGVRTIELGVPFSDPMADGPVIQRAAARALAAGVNLKTVFSLARRLVQKTPDLRLILFSYLNPLLQYGVEEYAREAVESGISATLVVDMVPEEAAEFLAAHRRFGLGTVFLASPTTSVERLAKIAESSTEFVYYVSRLGVTGEKSDVSLSLGAELSALRGKTAKPVAVGFGISTPEQAADVAKLADHVVIGSRFVSLIESSESSSEACFRVGAFARACVSAMEGSPHALA